MHKIISANAHFNYQTKPMCSPEILAKKIVCFKDKDADLKYQGSFANPYDACGYLVMN
jgi:hypothetical protein